MFDMNNVNFVPPLHGDLNKNDVVERLVASTGLGGAAPMEF